MIETLTVWHGNYPMLYNPEIDEWQSNHSYSTDYMTINADELPLRGDKSVDTVDPMLAEGFSLMADDKNLLVRNCQTLVNNRGNSHVITSLIKHFDSFDCTVHLALEFCTKGKIPADVFDRADVVSYHVVDNENSIKDSQEWIVDYFKFHGIKVSSSDARKVTEYCGVDTSSMVSACVSLAALRSGGTLTASDINHEIGKMGSRGPFELSNAVFGGRRDKAAEMLERDPDNLFPAMGSIRSKLEILIFIKCRDGKVQLGDMGVKNQWYLNNLKKDAQRASLDGLLYAMSRTQEIDYALKGGSHPALVEDEFRQYIDDVTKVFA